MPTLMATEHSPMAGKEPEPTAELETMLTSATNPEPMAVPAMEPEYAATSVPEPKVSTYSDQMCEPTSTREPVGCLVELEDDDSLPPLKL